MTIETNTVTLPAYWATALVNDDWSGLEPREAALCQQKIDQLAKDGWSVVDVMRDENGEAYDARFSTSYDLHSGDDVRAGDVLDYVMHKHSDTRSNA